MVRERVLKIVLVLFGLLFLAGIIPVAMFLSSKNQSDAGVPMLMSLYVVLGVFLLLAVRNPPSHRSLIAYAAWANLAHGAVMAVQTFEFPGVRDFKFGSITFLVIGAVLLTLAPAKKTVEKPAALAA
jgi:hypothetical protein